MVASPSISSTMSSSSRAISDNKTESLEADGFIVVKRRHEEDAAESLSLYSCYYHCSDIFDIFSSIEFS